MCVWLVEWRQRGRGTVDSLYIIVVREAGVPGGNRDNVNDRRNPRIQGVSDLKNIRFLLCHHVTLNNIRMKFLVCSGPYAYQILFRVHPFNHNHPWLMLFYPSYSSQFRVFF